MVAVRIVLSIGLVVCALSGCRKNTTLNQEELTGRSLSVALIGTEGKAVTPTELESRYIAPVGAIEIWSFPRSGSQEWVAELETAIEKASGRSYGHLTGGHPKRNLSTIVFDKQALRLQESFEVPLGGKKGELVRLLVAHFKHAIVGEEFLFVLCELAQFDGDLRRQQAQAVNLWIKNQTLPIIFAGNLNFGWDVATGEHDISYEELAAGGELAWILPEELRPTTCEMDRPVINDFIFATKELQSEAYSEIFTDLSGTSLCGALQGKPSAQPVFATFSL